MTDKKSTFVIDLEGNVRDVSREDASALEQLRQKTTGALDSIRQMGGALRSLRGSTEEVTAAKEQLKAKISAARDVVSASNLELLKQGVTYEKLADSTKKAAAAQAKLQAKKEAEELARMSVEAQGLGRGIKAIGGPVENLRGKMSALKETFGQAGGGMAALGVVAAGVVVAVAALVAGVVAATVSFAKFVIEGGNAARTANLLREASTGSAESAGHLGNQIETLARKVPTSREELNKLANELTRTLSGTRVSGQGIVDTMNAVAQASTAMGDQAGAAIGDIIKRSKQFGRVSINPFELQGTGVRFDDVAAQLAKQLKIGTAQARQALLMGTVGVDDAAKALRVTVEKRFGEINARRLLDVDVQLQKFKERLSGLTRDVHLEPLLNAMKDFFDLFDEQKSVTGATLKQIVTILGNDLIGSITKGTPAAKSFFKQLVIGTLDALIAFYKLRNALRDAWQSHETLRTGVKALGVGLLAIAGIAVGVTAAVVAAGVAMVAAFGELFLLPDQVAKALSAEAIGKELRAWVLVAEEAAGNFIQGLLDGIRGGITRVASGVGELADQVKDAFKSALGIHSPSVVFQKYGVQTTEGYAQGLEGSTGRAQAAADAMTPATPAGRAGGRGRSSGTSVTLVFNLPAGANGSGAQEAVKTLSTPSFLALLTKAIEDANTTMGIPMQGAPAT